MGLMDKVKGAMHNNTTNEDTTGDRFVSNVDETRNRSSVEAAGADLQDSRARRRAEETAALEGNTVGSNNSNRTGSNYNSTTAGSNYDSNAVGSNYDSTNTSTNAGRNLENLAANTTGDNYAQTQGMPQSGRANYSDVPGHEHSVADTQIDPLGENTDNTTTTLQHVTHEKVSRNEIEEVERLREQDRHVTHVQLHVQPILDTKVMPEVHHTNNVAPTRISETHVAAPGEAELLRQQVAQHQDTREVGPTTRTIVDKGERVNTTTHHHIKNMVQPAVQLDTQEQHVIHTVIPVQETINTAPIVHQASRHQPLSMAEFTKAGGTLGSGINHESVIKEVIDRENCERTVDGPAETMMEQLHLKSSHPAHQMPGSTNTTTGTTANTATL